MIILDTNILVGMSLRDSSAELLRAIRTANVERVAVPWVVMEELAARQALAYKKKHEAATAALRDLERSTPWSVPPRLGECDLEPVREHWRTRYSEITEVIPTSESALREGVYREANQLAPCKTVNSGRHKVGARDAAIWMTAVEYAREHSEETVYFVSNNAEDFGDGSAYPFPMDIDVAGLGDRFVLLTSLGGVLDKFATPVEIDDDQVRATLSHPDALKAVAREAESAAATGLTVLGGRGFPCALLPGQSGNRTSAVAQAWFSEPTVALGSVTSVDAFRIGEHVWCTATVRWVLAGPAVLEDPIDLKAVACAWETRAFLSPTNRDAGLTILRSSAPEAATEEETARFSWPGLPTDLEANFVNHLRGLDRSSRELQRSMAQLTFPAQPFGEFTNKLRLTLGDIEKG
ncbi:PIN domain-containing protein [Streptomyces sp. NPDC056930]|uniref:PIN domain-containing protein n=1 Tax=Streptomyces sp. NPDC056930 TaxID=3345967 RepID=UPI0036341300